MTSITIIDQYTLHSCPGCAQRRGCKAVGWQSDRHDIPARPALLAVIIDVNGHELFSGGRMPDRNHPESRQPVLELRVALTVRDFERSLKFYCDGLGIQPAALWQNGGGHALLLELGSGTLELFDEAQAGAIDGLEVGRRVSGQVRFALRVPEVQAAVDRLLAHGARLVHPAVVTPWGDTNARLQDPDGLQITLFQSGG
ncbi:VOC family protein [bacterium]|nr:MAG: VOC family protein [bacterium]